MTREEAKHVINSSDYFWLRPTDKERMALSIAVQSLEIDSKYEPWNPVSEWPKTTQEDVLVCDIDGDIYKAYYSKHYGWQRSEDFEKVKNVVAWMPLPEPYTGGMEEGRK